MIQTSVTSRAWISRNRPGFQSFKTGHQVYYSGRWPRDALIQATLDASVDSIRQVDGASALPDDVELAIAVEKGQRRELWAFCRSSYGDLPTPPDFDAAVCISRFQVLSPSRLLTARMIWKMRPYPVDAATGLAIGQVLASRGGGVSLYTLIDSLGGDTKHNANCILSLACNGYLALSDITTLSADVLVSLMEDRRSSATPSTERLLEPKLRKASNFAKSKTK